MTIFERVMQTAFRAPEGEQGGGKPPGGDPPAGEQKKEPPPQDGGDKQAEPKAKGSIYQDIGVDEPGAKGSPAWPETWREDYAGTDTKKLEQLKRYQSPQAALDALFAARQRISSGEYKRQLGPDATPEQVKAWREEQGLPEKPEAYELPLPAGVKMEQLDDAAKGRIAEFQKAFHENNVPPAVAAKLTEVYNQAVQQEMERTAAQDAERYDAHEDTLRAEWGAEFRKNLAMNEQFIRKHFGDEGLAIFEARLPNGTRLGDFPLFSKKLNEFARGEGLDVIVKGEGGSTPTVQGRLEEIRKIMSTDIGRYRREGLDKEYAELTARLEGKG